MSARRPLLALSIAVLVAAPVPAAGSPLGPQVPTGPLDAARKQLASGSLLDAVMAASGAAGVSVLRPAASFAPDPVAALARAVASAGDMAQQAAIGDPAAMRALHGQLLTSPPRTPAEAEAVRLAAAEQVDPAPLYASGATLAAAVDEALPLLAGLPRVDGAGVGCDLVDQAPAICVGGDGANTYERDYALLIDLGGNDRHLHAAGGADPLSGAPAASLTIDLGGDDEYATPVPSPGGAQIVFGGALLGGVGMLVDAGGDDKYSAWARGPALSTYGLGAGFGGMGVMADLAGNDTYQLRNTTSTLGVPNYRLAEGVGVGALGGTGILLDRGSGDDTYLVESIPAPDLDEDGNQVLVQAQAQGMGIGVAGVGLFHDTGGNDSMTLRAKSVADPDDSRPATEPGESDAPPGAIATIWGFGYGALGGAGLSISGNGNTVRAVEAVAQAPETGSGPISTDASAASIVLGIGLLGGYGGVHDEGGDDVYVSDLTSRAVHHHRPDQACGCPASALAQARGAMSQAMGVGNFGIGVLEDRSGNDRYISRAVSVAEAEARDDRESVPPPDPRIPGSDALAEAIAGTAVSRAQGAGVGGSGFLIDGAGDDVYESVTSSEAIANATARAEGAIVEGLALTDRAASLAQGAGDTGHGSLLDQAGTDTYATRNTSAGSATPPTDVAAGTTYSSVQGSVDTAATATFVDEGGVNDTFVALPADPACQGERGTGTWIDCGPGAGVGRNT